MRDCMNCGVCEWCIDRSVAAAEEADGLAAGIDPDDDRPDILTAAAKSVIRRRHHRPQDWREVLLARWVLRSIAGQQKWAGEPNSARRGATA